MSTYAEWAEKNESDIQGSGWGSDHLWHHEGTSPSRTTYYKCARCFWPFGHHYPSTPSIFKAMHDSGVPEKCARVQMWPVRPGYATQAEREHFEQVRACSAAAADARAHVAAPAVRDQKGEV